MKAVRLGKGPRMGWSAVRPFSASSCRRDTYGFIGLGQMGYPMARNLQAKLSPADKLVVFDIDNAATQRLAEEVSASQGSSVQVAGSVKELAMKSNTIITCLPKPQHVTSTFTALLGDLPPCPHSLPPLFIDCSTIDPSTSRHVASLVKDAPTPGYFVDAPMSGGVVGATAGKLTFMLGCPSDLLPRIEAVLLRMGARVLHCGEQGAGLAAKLANNYVLAVSNVAVAEAMNLGVRWGLDAKVLANVINASTGRCWPSEVNNPVPGVVEGAPAGRGYEGGFGVTLMEKDLGLAVVAAKEAGARLELAGEVKRVYESVCVDERWRGKDFSVVYSWLREANGGCGQ